MIIVIGNYLANLSGKKKRKSRSNADHFKQVWRLAFRLTYSCIVP